ncbi:hypothetical protein [Clostridium chromiireducens]|nr:hypothetical protein [Clostridium chromiireducens]
MMDSQISKEVMYIREEILQIKEEISKLNTYTLNLSLETYHNFELV